MILVRFVIDLLTASKVAFLFKVAFFSLQPFYAAISSLGNISYKV